MTASSDQPTIRLGLPKGRMQEEVVRLLADAGIRLAHGPREYRPRISLEGFEVKFLKPQNMVEMLQEDLSEDDPRHFYFDTINRNLTRLTSLTESLLGLAHPGETHLDRTDINEVVQEAIYSGRRYLKFEFQELLAK